MTMQIMDCTPLCDLSSVKELLFNTKIASKVLDMEQIEKHMRRKRGKGMSGLVEIALYMYIFYYYKSTLD